MIGSVGIKPGVEFKVIAPGGFVILAAIAAAAKKLGCNLTITSACDGTHSGPEDPHFRGEAYDVRTHDVPDKYQLLSTIHENLDPEHFFAFLEDPGGENEHIHAQVKKGTVYPPPQVMTA